MDSNEGEVYSPWIQTRERWQSMDSNEGEVADLWIQMRERFTVHTFKRGRGLQSIDSNEGEVAYS